MSTPRALDSKWLYVKHRYHLVSGLTASQKKVVAWTNEILTGLSNTLMLLLLYCIDGRIHGGGGESTCPFLCRLISSIFVKIQNLHKITYARFYFFTNKCPVTFNTLRLFLCTLDT